MRYHVTKDGCWQLLGRKNIPLRPLKEGEGLKDAATRVWEHFKGELPGGVVLECTCGNMECFNPDHREMQEHAGVGAAR